MSTGLPGLPVQDRRFSMAHAVAATAGVMRRNPAAIGIIAVTAALLGSMMEAAADQALGLPAFGTDRGSVIVHQVIAAVTSGFSLGGITHVVVGDLGGTRAAIGSAVARSLRLGLPLTGLNVVSDLGIGFTALLLVVPGVLLGLRWFVLAPARVVEGPPLNDAFDRSRELTTGHRWPLFGLMAAYLLFAAIVSGLIGVLGTELGAEAGGSASLAIGVAADAAGSAILNAVNCTGVAVCYVQLRRVRGRDAPGQVADVFA